jgi:hypothetical protein
MNIPKIEEAIRLLYQTYIEDQDVATQRGIAITAMNEMVKLLGGEDVVTKIESVPYSARVRAQHLFEDTPQRQPLTVDGLVRAAQSCLSPIQYEHFEAMLENDLDAHNRLSRAIENERDK